MSVIPAPARPSAPSATHPIPTRRISFEESIADLEAGFAADANPFACHTISTLSGVFPDGEDFFVRSVRHYRDQITDPELKRQVTGFIGQESVHGREHRLLNERLEELGYPAKKVERFAQKMLGFRERMMSPEERLALTAALEHFTATFAEVLLREPEVRRLINHPGLVELFSWHAIEEAEHKAVAFDVYKAVGGTEKVRRRVMNIATVAFTVGLTTQMLISALTDRRTWRRGMIRRFRSYLSNPIMTKDVWRRLRDYNRPDFHPDDHDTEALLDEWRERYFGDEGQLNELLVTAA